MTRSCLVTQTPDNDRRLVDKLSSHSHYTINVCCLELWYVRKRCLAIKILMALDVCFALQVNTILVAEIIEVRIVRIVGGTHVVNVRTLHQHNLTFHLLTRDNLTRQWVGIVSVYTLEFHWLTIDIVISSSQTELVLTCRSVLDFNRAETSLETYRFNYFLTLHQLTNNNIDVRLFSCPCCRIVHGKCLTNVGLSLTITNGLSLRIFESCNQLVVVSKESVLIDAPTKVEILCILCCEVLQCCVEINSSLTISK